MELSVSGAVDEYQRLCPDAPGIVFCVDIAHSKLVAQAFTRRGYRAAHVDGATPRQQRRELIAALGDGGLDLQRVARARGHNDGWA